MGFELFKKSFHLGKTCSIGKNGIISISKSISMECGLKGYGYCDFYFDKKAKKVGLKLLVHKSNTSGRIRFTEKSGTTISASAFVRHCKILPNKGARFEANWNTGSGMIEFST